MALMKPFFAGIGLLAALAATPTAQIQVMSAGAVEAALATIVQQFQRATDSPQPIQVEFGTGPQLAERLAVGMAADVLIAPAAVVEQAVRDRVVFAETRLDLGRVGVGVVIRADARIPDVATPDALAQAVRAADAIVYNQGSSGLYVERLFERLGLSAVLKTRGQRVVNGAAIMERIIGGSGNEIGFGAITEIRMYEARGAKLAGPLPPAIQNYTTYAAAMMVAAPSPEGARSFLNYLASPVARRLLISTGVEPVP
jgi:molybdate transport system substrate-binding protein